MFTVRPGACLHARAKGKHLLGLGVDCPSGGDGAWTWRFRVCLGSVCTVFVSVVSCLFLCVRFGHHHHHLSGNISASSRCGGPVSPHHIPCQWLMPSRVGGSQCLGVQVCTGSLLVAAWWGLAPVARSGPFRGTESPQISGFWAGDSVCSGIASGRWSLRACHRRSQRTMDETHGT